MRASGESNKEKRGVKDRTADSPAAASVPQKGEKEKEKEKERKANDRLLVRSAGTGTGTGTGKRGGRSP